MRSTIVPAQVTTVEDKITGKIGLSQLLLLTIPVFSGSLMFVILPPFFSYALYKIVLITACVAICALLSIRFRGRILLSWALAILRYNLRPKYYVFNKNSAFVRDVETTQKAQELPSEEALLTKAVNPIASLLTTAERVRVEGLMADPQANFHLKTNRKGKLHVHITEVRPQI